MTEDHLAAQGATPEEAAAIVAAVARFAADTAAAPPGPAADGDRWLRAARLQDAGGDPAEHGPWGDPHPWGRPRD